MQEIFSVITNSDAETMAVGEKLAATVSKGVVFTLTGDLGAGKTHFVKGFTKGMGSPSLVTSPTFTLLNIYDDGQLPLYHFDMYRLSGKEEAEEMGFNEYFDTNSLDGVVVVEWPEQVEGLINCPHINVEITKLDESTRQIVVGGGK